VGVHAQHASAVEASLTERYRQMANAALEERAVDPALRGLDIVVAAVVLGLSFPLLLALGVLVRLTSRGPALYRGLRVGRAGELFVMLKFRTLKEGAETRIGPYLGVELAQMTTGELTRMGRVLRDTHLDEVPQLWNVLKGDMSLVGPRPIRPVFFDSLCRDIPQYWQRLVIRPGISGFAQLRVTRELSWQEKLAHDLEYIADRSLRLYLSVVVSTVRRSLLRRSDRERVP
jgi:lipopolysaccharide/colanic/teichoic acid biosynthesis glycosyltransferase